MYLSSRPYCNGPSPTTESVNTTLNPTQRLGFPTWYRATSQFFSAAAALSPAVASSLQLPPAALPSLLPTVGCPHTFLCASRLPALVSVASFPTCGRSLRHRPPPSPDSPAAQTPGVPWRPRPLPPSWRIWLGPRPTWPLSMQPRLRAALRPQPPSWLPDSAPTATLLLEGAPTSLVSTPP